MICSSRTPYWLTVSRTGRINCVAPCLNSYQSERWPCLWHWVLITSSRGRPHPAHHHTGKETGKKLLGWLTWPRTMRQINSCAGRGVWSQHNRVATGPAILQFPRKIHNFLSASFPNVGLLMASLRLLYLTFTEDQVKTPHMSQVE